jgi:spore germination cell wall hydrolase CwlJ-like protein
MVALVETRRSFKKNAIACLARLSGWPAISESYSDDAVTALVSVCNGRNVLF